MRQQRHAEVGTDGKSNGECALDGLKNAYRRVYKAV